MNAILDLIFNRCRRFNRFAFILAVFFILGAISCSDSNAPQKSNALPKQNTFDLSNKTVTNNGNMAVAVELLHSDSNNSVWDRSETITAESLTKSPYSSIGKLRKITGRIYKVEELPPKGLKGRWSELLLLTDNPNSPLGTTTVDYIYNGDISKIRSGQIITCAGYFVGTFDSENAMGGKVEAVVIVGNDVRRK